MSNSFLFPRPIDLNFAQPEPSCLERKIHLSEVNVAQSPPALWACRPGPTSLSSGHPERSFDLFIETHAESLNLNI
jgi:hypothetical protein